MRFLKIAFYILLGLLVLIQFVPVDRPKAVKGGYEFTQAEQLPDDVALLLKNACYDCHSNRTKYPWYAYVAPVSWLVIRDVRVGQKHLNFSEWRIMSKKDKLEILDEIAEEVGDGEMPMKIYPPLHPEARLSDSDRQLLVDWADAMAEKVFEE